MSVELSLSSYAVKVAARSSPYLAIPVFPSRAFRHSAVYVRSDRGIETPQDLKGKRIGVPEYQLTANVGSAYSSRTITTSRLQT